GSSPAEPPANPAVRAFPRASRESPGAPGPSAVAPPRAGGLRGGDRVAGACNHRYQTCSGSRPICSRRVARARHAECYTVSETYWLDLRCESTGMADEERWRRINVQE